MFFEKAKTGANEWWRYFLGSILIFFGWQTVASIPLFLLMGYIAVKGGKISMNIAQAAKGVGVSENTTLFVMLSTFVLACGVLYFVVKYLHKQKFSTLLTSRTSFCWKRAIYGFLLWFLTALIFLGISYQSEPEALTLSFNTTTFIPLLLICIFTLPFQTSFEEFFFRGYLTQATGTVTGSRILAILLPGIIFGLLHSFNPEVFKYGFWLMMPFYIGMGIFLGLLAVLDNGLEIPLGVHFANNLTGAVLVSVESSALPTTPLFIIKNYNPADEVLSSILTMLFFIILSSYIFRWKWKKLFIKI